MGQLYNGIRKNRTQFTSQQCHCQKPHPYYLTGRCYLRGNIPMCLQIIPSMTSSAPSTREQEPEMNAAAGESKKTIVAETSDSVPIRRAGV